MSRRTLTFRYVDVPPLLGPPPVSAWRRFISAPVRNLLPQLALTVTGYLRPRPDPVIECVLRSAFTDLDRELAEILGDRSPHGMHDLPESCEKARKRRCWVFSGPKAENTQHLVGFVNQPRWTFARLAGPCAGQARRRG